MSDCGGEGGEGDANDRLEAPNPPNPPPGPLPVFPPASPSAANKSTPLPRITSGHEGLDDSSSAEVGGSGALLMLLGMALISAIR
jgi:hypothetical protein